MDVRITLLAKKKTTSREKKEAVANIGFSKLAEMMWEFILPKPQPDGDEPMEY